MDTFPWKKKIDGIEFVADVTDDSRVRMRIEEYIDADPAIFTSRQMDAETWLEECARVLIRHVSAEEVRRQLETERARG